MRILVVEDNAALADGISSALKRMEMAVDVVGDGCEADHILRTQIFDLVVMDLNLPGYDGLEVLKRYRQNNGQAQVLILTARDELQDRVKGLDLGADDYLTKPFELGEFEARIRALLRRHSGLKSPEIRVGELVFDSISRRVLLRGEPLDIPRREFCLLELMISRVGQVISKEQIADGLANFDDDISPNAIELYISRLRKRLVAAGVTIKTVRGLGYLMEK
ncbi:response regulator transcription factor [Kiloniella laminariae]|uniref:Response regulator transcription factor n=1 Tax=Kiloniella laminariae TaxID=454162 RepID=A0ABT4LJR2_9PROT|nr:response regulator transcription factor [Kiloniella laminariae]MCZ4280227.1 response regulator transcription factor [Kiloniella laminariae]